jgi:hypothetical protein
MSGAIRLIPLYAFMVWTATPLPYIIREDEKDGSRDRVNTGTNCNSETPKEGDSWETFLSISEEHVKLSRN